MKKGFFSASSKDVHIEIEDHIYKKFQKKNAEIIHNLRNIILPMPGEQLRLITMKSFNAIAFINLIAQNEIIEELILVIYAINMKAAKNIIDLKENGRIDKLTLIISSILNAGHVVRAKSVQMLIDYNYNITFVNSHAKVTVVRTNSNYYVIEGSGNLSSNGVIEQYVIDNDRKMYEFSKNWIDEIKVRMSYRDDFTELCQEETEI